MANVFRPDEEARRAVMRRLALRGITRRQEALRSSWRRMSRAEVGAELVAIGQDLLAAAPLFLPGSVDSGGVFVGQNGAAMSRNGRPVGEASGCVPHDRAGGGAGWEGLVRLACEALRELEGLLRDLREDACGP